LDIKKKKTIAVSFHTWQKIF